MEDKPFALIGVNINCYDPRKLKEVMDKEKLNFRSFADTSDGEGLGKISSAWNLMGTPTLFVLDHKGMIRYSLRGVPNARVIDDVLNKLVKEAEGNDKKEKEADAAGVEMGPFRCGDLGQFEAGKPLRPALRAGSLSPWE